MPVKKVDKRDIIKASLRVFRQKGYHSTTMSDIAAACGLLKGSIYHHFEGKEDLMLQTIDFLHSYYSREVFSIAHDESLTGLEQLDKLAAISEEIFMKEKGGCLMANIGLETANDYPRFRVRIKAYFEEWIQSLEHIFRKAYDAQTAREIAEFSVAEIEGAVMLMQVYHDKCYLERAHQHIKKQFIAALQQQERPAAKSVNGEKVQIKRSIEENKEI